MTRQSVKVCKTHPKGIKYHRHLLDLWEKHHPKDRVKYWAVYGLDILDCEKELKAEGHI